MDAAVPGRTWLLRATSCWTPANHPRAGTSLANYEKIELFGHKYEDTNADGSIDASETGLAGWTINLTGTTGSGASVNESTTTGAGGYYEFTDLEPGTYTVAEVGQSSSTQWRLLPARTRASRSHPATSLRVPTTSPTGSPGKIEGEQVERPQCQRCVGLR